MLLAIGLRLQLACSLAEIEPLRQRLLEVSAEIDSALEELRGLSSQLPATSVTEPDRMQAGIDLARKEVIR